MARGRLISKSLGSSRKFHAALQTGGKLGEFCQVLFPLIVVNTDDFGRMPGDAFTVKHLVLPSSPRPEHDFDRALDILANVGLIERYCVEDAVYLQVTQFDEHQPNLHKRSTSRFPESPGNSGISGKFPEVPESPGNSGKFRTNLTELNLTEPNRTEPRTEPNPEENPEPTTPGAAGVKRRSGNGNGLRERFETFWSVYPRKVAKQNAWRVWQQCHPDADLLAQMLAALRWQSQQDSWMRDSGRFIPHAGTWLASSRWQDEPSRIPRVSERTLALARAGEEFLKS